MKKRFVLALLLLSLFNTGFTFDNGPVATDVAGSALECKAPPPSYLNITNVTPYSISLAWGPVAMAPPTIYFKLQGYDNTNSSALPTVYTTAWNYTYAGLSPGHNYTFTLQASYCEGGEYGTSIMANSNSGVIIVDLIVGIQECTPNTSRSITVGQPFNIGVQSSSTVPMQTLTNPYSGQFSYNGDTCTFALAFVPSTSMVYKEVAGEFTFDSTENGAAAICKYDTTEIFKVTYVASRGGAATGVGLRVEFKQSVSNYNYCGNYVINSIAAPAADLPEEAGESPVEDRALMDRQQNGIISPNPFSQSATLQYTIEQTTSVEIGLYDVTGRLVRAVLPATQLEPGNHTATVDGFGLPDGLYFLRLRTGLRHENFTLIKRE